MIPRQENSLMIKRNRTLARWAFVVACAFALTSAAAGQEHASLDASQEAASEPASEKRLTLQEAVDLALRHNHGLRASSFAVAAEREQKRMAESNYFPTINNESSLLHITDVQRIDVPPGAFGAAIPSSTVFLTQGTNTFETSSTTLAQPITQLIKIHESNKVAAAEVKSSEASLKKASTDVVFKVHELYYRVLTTQLQRDAAELLITSGSEGLNEDADQVKNGSLLEVARVESQASLLEAKETLLTTEMQISDLTFQLNDLLGLPLDTKLKLDPDVDVRLDLPPREQALQTALNDNPEIKEAMEAVSKARAAHGAVKAEYIPDVGAFARYSYQNGLPFFDRNFGTFGIHFSYDLFDAGKRRALIRERRDQVSEAEENLRRTQDEIEVRVKMIYNRLEVARAMVEVRREYLGAKLESARLAEDQFKQGITLTSQRDASRAQAIKARAGLLDASLAYLLADDDLARTLGSTAP